MTEKFKKAVWIAIEKYLSQQTEEPDLSLTKKGLIASKSLSEVVAALELTFFNNAELTFFNNAKIVELLNSATNFISMSEFKEKCGCETFLTEEPKFTMNDRFLPKRK